MDTNFQESGYIAYYSKFYAQLCGATLLCQLVDGTIVHATRIGPPESSRNEISHITVEIMTGDQESDEVVLGPVRLHAGESIHDPIVTSLWAAHNIGASLAKDPNPSNCEVVRMVQRQRSVRVLLDAGVRPDRAVKAALGNREREN